MKKAIVTGATGYIGSHLVRQLLSEGWDVSIIAQPEFGYFAIDDIKDDIKIFEYNKNIDSLIVFFQDVEPDVVFHLAAAVITNYMPNQISTLICSNILFGTEILEAMLHSNCRLIINTGSYWQNYNSETYNPVDLYAATKEAFEKVLCYYVDAHYFKSITLRLFDIFGEDDKRPKLLNLLCKISQDETTLDISPGEQYLELVHISDVCRAYIKAFDLLMSDNTIKNEIYGICSENRIQLKELIYLFEKVIGKKLNVNIGAKAYKNREVMSPCLIYKKLPDWEVQISLEQGIELMIKNNTKN